MAIGGSGKGIQIIVGTDYKDKDLKRAQNDLNRLQKQAAKTASPMQRLGTTLRSNLGPALAMVGAAAGALAIKFAVDGVKAAVAEQAALVKLEQALQNVGEAFRTDEVNAFIDSLQRSSGIAEDQLRPAFQRLVTATGSVTEAQKLLQLAMDISVGSGRSLESVSLALSKAANGQVTSLRRLGVPLTDAAVKSGDLAVITDELTDAFGGQAAAQANTYKGQLDRLGIALGEVQEAFGMGFLGGLGDTSGGTDDLAASIKDLEPAFEMLGTQIGQAVSALGDLSTGLQTLGEDLGVPRSQNAADFLSYFVGLTGIVKSAGISLKTYLSIFGSDSDVVATAVDRHLDYRDAVVRAAAATEGAIDPTQMMTEQLELEAEAAEETAKYFSDLNDELSIFTDFTSQNDALRGYQEALDDLRKSVKENGKEFGDANPKMRENAENLEAIFNGAVKVAEGQQTAAEKIATMEDAATDANDVLKVLGIPPDVRASLLAPFDDLIAKFRDNNTLADNLKQRMEGLPTGTRTFTYDIVVNNADSIPPHLRAAGGPIYGVGRTKGSDTVPAMLTPGEFVIRKSAVNKFGADVFSQLNRGINPLAGMGTSSAGGGSGLTINGGITVQSASGERADQSLPRALRRMAFLAGA
jgi:uncharacterized phage infection (PIP) family protein YhgE